MTQYQRLTEKAAPRRSGANVDGAEASIKRALDRLYEAEDSLIAAHDRGQKLAAVNKQASDVSEAEVRKTYNVGEI